MGRRADDDPRTLVLAGGIRLAIPWELPVGSRVRVRIPASAVVLSRAPLASSARNEFSGVVTRIVPRATGLWQVHLRVGRRTLLAWLTVESVARLGLRPGAGAYASVKAAALRLLGAAGPFR